MSATPNPHDLFTRIMMRAYTEKIPLTTGFQSFFGRTESDSETVFSPDSNIFELDIQRETKGLATLVQRGMFARSVGGTQKAVKLNQFTNVQRKYPLVEEVGVLHASQLLDRLAGLTGREQQDQKLKLAILAAQLNKKLTANCYRTFEYMASQSILTGKMPALTGATASDLLYDFRRLDTHRITLTYAQRWSLVSNSILNDLDDWGDLIRVDGNMNPDFVAMGDKAIGYFQKNAEILAQSNNITFESNVNIIRAGMPKKYERFIKSGFKLRYQISTPRGYDFYIFDYKGHYTDTSGNIQKYLPDDAVFMASTDARCDRAFGPNERLPLSTADRQMYRDYLGYDMRGTPQPPMIQEAGGVLPREAFYYDLSRDETATSLKCRVQAAPVFVTTATDGFVDCQDVDPPDA